MNNDERSMTIQVLVATMNQNDFSLPKKMNLMTDAIIANQCERNSIDQFDWNGHVIKYLNFAERGVGLNRNNALMRATGDICLFADDDMVYCDNPNADVIVFNLIEEKPTRYIIKKRKKVWYLNYLRFGSARIAVRLSKVRDKGIFFNLNFGGGTLHCHGEDNLFLTDCLKNRLRIIAIPAYIAKLTEERPSTWNEGFNEKYIKDQGILYKTISHRFWFFLCMQDVLRHKKQYPFSFFETLKMMLNAR